MSSHLIEIGLEKWAQCEPANACCENRAPYCKRLWSPGIDSEDRFRQAGNRFLGSLKSLQIEYQIINFNIRQNFLQFIK
jgi:hypothetical protein